MNGGAADQAGVHRHDLIEEVNRNRVRDVSELEKDLEAVDGTRLLCVTMRGTARAAATPGKTVAPLRFAPMPCEAVGPIPG